MMPPNSYCIEHLLRITDLINSMHTKLTCRKTSGEDMYLNEEYEMHMGTNFDCLFFQSSRLLQASERQLKRKPMWARMNIDSNCNDVVPSKPKFGKINAKKKPVNVSRDWWQLDLAVSLPTSYNEPVLRPNADTLRRPYSTCWSYYTANTPTS